jgi:group I intron endonuclease
MIIYSIYKFVNKVNGKVYIGFDSNWPNRKRYHKSKHGKVNSKFYNAIKKYGWDNFESDVVYQSLDGTHTLSAMENYFIQQYNSFHNGYNSTLGGDGILGFKHTPEQIEKRVSKVRGKKHSKEWCENISKNKIGKPRNDMLGDNNPMRKPDTIMRMSGKNHPKAIPIIVNGISYDYKKQAMDKLGISKRQLNKILSSNL